MIDDAFELLEVQLAFKELSEREKQELESIDMRSKKGTNPSTLRSYICFIVDDYSAIEKVFLESEIGVDRVSLTYHVQSKVKGGIYTVPHEGVKLSSKHKIPLKVNCYCPTK